MFAYITGISKCKQEKVEEQISADLFSKYSFPLGTISGTLAIEPSILVSEML